MQSVAEPPGCFTKRGREYEHSHIKLSIGYCNRTNTVSRTHLLCYEQVCAMADLPVVDATGLHVCSWDIFFWLYGDLAVAIGGPWRCRSTHPYCICLVKMILGANKRIALLD